MTDNFLLDSVTWGHGSDDGGGRVLVAGTSVHLDKGRDRNICSQYGLEQWSPTPLCQLVPGRTEKMHNLHYYQILNDVSFWKNTGFSLPHLWLTLDTWQDTCFTCHYLHPLPSEKVCSGRQHITQMNEKQMSLESFIARGKRVGEKTEEKTSAMLRGRC